MENGRMREMGKERIVLKSNEKIDALEVILSYGFKDTAPEISLCTGKVFEKRGKKYKFLGWHHHYTGFSRGRTWEDVELEEI